MSKPAIMRILVISNNYPSENAPTYGIFVYNLVQKFVELGHQVDVIACESIWNVFMPRKEKVNYGVEKANIYRPKTITASNKWILGFNTHIIGEFFSVRSVREIVLKNELKFDLVYAHFLINGMISVKSLYDFGKPIFVAEGELKNINLRRSYYKDNTYKNLISKIRGFVSVSPQIKNNLVEVGVREDRIIIKPNAIDPNKFYPRDKRKMRVKHGLPLDKKLIVFLGRFVHDKGPLRVLNSVKGRDDIGLIFIGKGNQELEGENIVFKDKVVTTLVPEYLSAADIFVLPTLHEGSCNAIIEAMACGLPIVSSDIPEIRFQCHKDSSLLVDPMDEIAIGKAINSILMDDDMKITMGKAAYEYSKKFEIKNRAQDILRYLEENL